MLACNSKSRLSSTTALAQIRGCQLGLQLLLETIMTALCNKVQKEFPLTKRCRLLRNVLVVEDSKRENDYACWLEKLATDLPNFRDHHPSVLARATTFQLRMDAHLAFCLWHAACSLSASLVRASGAFPSRDPREPETC